MSRERRGQRSVLAAGAVRVRPGGPVRARVAAPASKSVTNRLLVQALLAEGSSRLIEPLDSDDATAMREAIAALGAGVDADGADLVVTGTGGSLVATSEPIGCRLSGTTIRFLTACAPLAAGPVVLTGADPLLRRPIGALVTALRTLGADVADDGGFPPVRAGGGGLPGGSVVVDATGSSQFASALLLAAPCADDAIDLTVTDAAAVRYIDLTVATMRSWGAEVEDVEPGRWRVRPTGYTAQTTHVEADASTAAHLMALAVATGGAVTVTNIPAVTAQPDAGITDVLAAMGASVEVEAAGAEDLIAVTVRGPERLVPVDVDLTDMPDQVTTIAALAALADGTSHITGVAVARGHETDRLAALAAELGRLGVRVVEERDGLVIHGGTGHGPARLMTHEDHRLAMSFAAIAAVIEGVEIADPGCVAKTYPGFWTDIANMGIDWEALA